MRITILVRILWTAGAQRIAIHEAQTLRDLGHEVDLVFLRKSTGLTGYEDILSKVQHTVYSEAQDSPLTPLFSRLTGRFMPSRAGEGRADLNLIWSFPASLRRRKVDLLVCHDELSGVAGYLANKRFGIPYEVVIHERVSNMPWVRPRILARAASACVRIVLRSAQSVFGITDSVSESVRKLYHVPVKTAFPGLEANPAPGFDKRSKRIISSSLWSDVKRPFDYIPIMAALPEYQFEFLGNWISQDYRLTFLRRLAELGLDKRVALLSSLSVGEMMVRYQQSRFYLRIGNHEYGPAMGTIEALENGLPPILYDVGSADLIANYGCGWKLESTDPKDVRDAVRKLDNPVAYTELQSRARALIADFSWVRHCAVLCAGDARDHFYGPNAG